MNRQLQTQVNIAPAPKLSFTAAQGGLLQRKCACGGSAGISGECEGCQKKQLTISRYSADRRAPSGLLSSRAGLALSTSLSDSGASVQAGTNRHFGRVHVGAVAPSGTGGERAVSQPGDRSEEEADRAAAAVMRALSSPVFEEKQEASEAPDLSQTPPLIQREVADENVPEMEVAPEATTEPETATEEAVSAGLIVEDDAGEVGPGQMRKSDFLDELRAAICAAADAELAAVGRDTEGCPYIERWIEYYHARDSQHIERAIRHYAPEAASVASARDYIPLISERVRGAVAVWARTGAITGVPAGTPAALPEASSNAAASASRAIQFKEQDGGAAEAGNPAAIQAQLGSGHSLDGGLKSRMESAFGYDFSRVRVHTDTKAAALSSNLNARAFTIGSDVAFGAGEYRPGTPIGDALIAHELAHVAQQGAATTPLRKGETESSGLEEDADVSAVGAVLSLWGKAKAGLANISKNAMPRLRSGLRLSRCGCSTLGGQEWRPFCILGDATYKGKVEGHLNTLNGTTQGSGVFSDLSTDRGSSLIDIRYRSGSAGFLPGKISYDPDASGPTDRCPGTPTGWAAAPRHVFLFHEVSHAYIYYVKSLGTHAERECMATGLGKYFTDISYNENKLRCELKLPIRPCYDGECTNFPPPTCGT